MRLNLPTLSPSSVLRVQLGIIVVSVALALAAVLILANILNNSVGTAASQSSDALVVSNGEALLGDMLSIMAPRAGAFLTSPEFAALDPATQRLVRAELFRTDGEPPDPALPDIEMALSLKDAVALQQAMDVLLSRTLPAFANRDQLEDVQVIRMELEGAVLALPTYFERPTVANFRLLKFNLLRLRDRARLYFPTLSTEVAGSFEGLQSQVKTGRLLLPIGLAVLGINAFIITLFMGRRLQQSLERAQSEGAEVIYRNNQLNALYAVFSEITDSLSLHYVVDATMRESRRIVDADTVVLRLVRRQELVVAGSLTAQGEEVKGLETLQLGEGAVGRVARRGKTLRIGEAGHAISEGTWTSGMESSLIVPLIVGARVVGTLACWSRKGNAFSEDDQRVLEMMASQVATAVAAADSTEVSERRARLDPLTGLLNRRELNEELAGPLAELADSGRSAVVVMLDIDHFKHFNDDYGHKVGDVTLQKVAAVMRNSLRESDKLYRYGGEEFVIIMLDADREQGQLLAERVRAAVASTPLTGEAMEPVGPVTISMGVSLFPEHARDFSVLIQLADEAMYQSKQDGRNRVTLWSASIAKEVIAA